MYLGIDFPRYSETRRRKPSVLEKWSLTLLNWMCQVLSPLQKVTSVAQPVVRVVTQEGQIKGVGGIQSWKANKVVSKGTTLSQKETISQHPLDPGFDFNRVYQTRARGQHLSLGKILSIPQMMSMDQGFRSVCPPLESPAQVTPSL